MHFLTVRKEANSVPDARYTALVLYSLGLFHRITGDDSFIGPDKKAMKCMVETWDILAETNSIQLTAEAGARRFLGGTTLLGNIQS